MELVVVCLLGLTSLVSARLVYKPLEARRVKGSKENTL